MATRKSAPKKDAPSGGLNLSVRESEGVKRTERPREDNPLEQYVDASLERGMALAVDVNSRDEAKKVSRLLRRAAQTRGVGLNQSTTDNGDGTFTVDFQAKGRKRARRYTVQDIREWAAANGYGELSGPVSKSIREEFKVANGYASSTADRNNNG